jgi:hypothetical protein
LYDDVPTSWANWACEYMIIQEIYYVNITWHPYARSTNSNRIQTASKPQLHPPPPRPSNNHNHHHHHHHHNHHNHQQWDNSNSNNNDDNDDRQG